MNYATTPPYAVTPTLAEIEHLTGAELDNYQPEPERKHGETQYDYASRTHPNHCICPPGTPVTHLAGWDAYECDRCHRPVIDGHSPNAPRPSLAEFRDEQARDEYMIHGDDQ